MAAKNTTKTTGPAKRFKAVSLGTIDGGKVRSFYVIRDQWSEEPRFVLAHDEVLQFDEEKDAKEMASILNRVDKIIGHINLDI